MYIMIKDAMKLYNSYQHLNIHCYSCGNNDHIAIECPKVHLSLKREKVIANFLAEENIKRKNFKRKERKKFKALLDLELVQEAATQHQMVQHNELYFEQEEEEDNKIRSYSSIDDILERNIYDLQPLVYAADSTQLRAVNFVDTNMRSNSLTSDNTQHDQYEGKRKKKKGYIQQMGEIESFVNTNYDRYYHNLNLDKVRNFEVFHPENNIIKMLVEFEEVRLKKLVENRLGVKAAHISRILIKGFRLHERAIRNGTQTSFNSIQSVDIVEKKQDHSENRRQSATINPGDIAMYNTGMRKMFTKDFTPPTSPPITPTLNGARQNNLHSLLQVPANAKRMKDQPRNSMFVASNFGMDKNNVLRTDMKTIQEEKRSLDDNLLLKVRTGTRNPSIAFIKKQSMSSAESESSENEGISSKVASSSADSSMTLRSSSVIQSVNLRAKEQRPSLQASGLSDQRKLSIMGPNAQNRNRASMNFMAFQGRAANDKRTSTVTFNNNVNQSSSPLMPQPSMFRLDHEETDHKKPIALFDFTQLVKKMSQKLDENSKSACSQSATIRKNDAFRTLESSDSSKLIKGSSNLFIEMIHRSKKTSNKTRKSRSSSEDFGKGVKDFIDKYGLEEMMKDKK